MNARTLVKTLLLTLALLLVPAVSPLADVAHAAFGGKIKNIRVIERTSSAGYRVVVIVKDDNDNEVNDVEVQFEEPFEGPSPQENPLELNFDSADDELGEQTFVFDGLEFDGDAVGLEYTLTATMRGAEGQTLGLPHSETVVVETEDSDVTVIEGHFKGHLQVGPGETVEVAPDALIEGKITVNGGTIILGNGAIVTKKVTVDEGGSISASGATFDGRVLIRGGSSGTVNDCSMGSNIRVEGGTTYETTGTIVGGNLRVLGAGSTTISDCVVMGTLRVKDSQSTTVEHTTAGRLVVVHKALSGADTPSVTLTSNEVDTMRVNAAGDVDLGGDHVAKDDIDIDADGNLTVSGTVDAGDDLGFTAHNGSTLTVTGDISAGSDVIFEGRTDTGSIHVWKLTLDGKNVDISGGTVTGGEGVEISAQTSLAIEARQADFISNLPVLLTCDDDVEIRTTAKASKLEGPGLSGSLIIVAGGNLELEGNADIDLQDSSFAVGGDVIFTSDATITINGDVSAGDDIRMRSDDGLVVNDVINAVGEVDMRVAGGDGGLIINGAVQAETGDIEMRNDGNGGLVVNDTINAVGCIEMRSDGNGGLVVNDVIQAEGNIEMRSDGNGGLVVNDTINAVGCIDMKAAGGGGIIVAQDARIDGNLDPALEDAGGVNIESDTTATLDGSIVARALEISADDVVLGVTARIDLDLDPALDAIGRVDIDSGASTTLDGSISADEVTLTSGGSITALATAKIDVNLDPALDSAGLVVSAGTDFALHGQATAAQVDIKGGGAVVVSKTGGINVDLDPVLDALDSVSIDSGTSTIVNGTLTAGDDVTVTAGADLSISGSVTTATGVVSIQSPEGSCDVSGDNHGGTVKAECWDVFVHSYTSDSDFSAAANTCSYEKETVKVEGTISGCEAI